MLGAIVGDTVGSVYEWNNIKTTEFPLFVKTSEFTDDSVTTVAVAHALADTFDGQTFSSDKLVSTMRSYGKLYPNAGYGGRFDHWLRSPHPKPYDSYGNGSAMRVSPVAWVSDDLTTVERLALETAEITHNHPEGVKGAQATAACIFMARKGADNDEIRCYIQKSYGYDLDFTVDEIRPTYDYDVTCQGTVPQAIVAFLESSNFEDALRLAVSLGGDSDTLAAITCSIAQGRYGIPDDIAEETGNRLTEHLRHTVERFCEQFHVNP